MKFLLNVLISLTLLVGCSSSTDEREKERKEIVDSVHEPLDKAKGLEQQILDNASDQRKQLDDM